MIKLFQSIFLIIYPIIVSGSDCFPHTDDYYEKNIIGKRIESDQLEFWGKSYSTVTTFNKDHSFVGIIVDKKEHTKDIKAVSGEWKISQGELHEIVNNSYIIFPIGHSIDKIICMNKKIYKAKTLSGRLYISTKIA